MADKMRTLHGTKGFMFDGPNKILPSFSLTTKDLPEIKDWKVGNKYMLEIQVEQTSMAKEEYMPGQPLMARVKILKIKSNSDSAEDKRGKKGYE